MIPNLDPAMQVGLFVMIFVFLLGGVNQVLKIIDHFRAKPPNHEQFVKIEHCREARATANTGLNQRLSNIEADVASIDQGDRRGRSDIHRDVRRVEERVSKLEGQIELFGQRQISQGGILDKILHELGELKGRQSR